MPKVATLHTTGTLGATVAVVERGTWLYLRHTVARRPMFVPLKHHDVTRAKRQANELARELAKVRAAESGAPGARADLTVADLFARYARNVSAFKKGDQPREDERRRILWTAFLGAATRAASVTPADVDRFAAKRRLGQIVVDGLSLGRAVKPRTVDADIVWLQSVYNWADRAKILTGLPLRGSRRPDVATQLRPMADAARVAKLLKVANKVHPRFALLLTAVRYLGWRISAVCQIDGADVRLTKAPDAPHGMIRKNWQTDKEGVAAWLPIPKPLAVALKAAGVTSGPLFPAPRSPDTPMSRYYARELLERAEALAKLAPIDGGDWHPYRRLWATERKALPLADVAQAGGWADQRTVQKYQQRDPKTTAKVMLFTAPAQKTRGQTHGQTQRRPKAPKGTK